MKQESEAERLFNEGEKYLENNEFAKAEEALRKANDLDPQYEPYLDRLIERCGVKDMDMGSGLYLTSFGRVHRASAKANLIFHKTTEG